MKRLAVGVWLMAGCGNTPAVAPAGGTGPAGLGSAATACDAARPKVEQLYRAGAPARDRARLDELVADNTTMVMNDCAQSPAKTAACIAEAATVAELEACLIPLDDEGTEGEHPR